MMKANFVALASVAWLAVSPPALAAPCAGFTDVDDSSVFCPHVDWLKNRAITLGCTSATLYCPNQLVTRLSMAAFMNRLGLALTPTILYQEASGASLDLDNPANRVRNVCAASGHLSTVGEGERGDDRALCRRGERWPADRRVDGQRHDVDRRFAESRRHRA